MESLFVLDTPALELVVRSLLVYGAFLLLVRMSGKRTVGEFTPFDLIVVVLLAESAQGALLGGDESVLGTVIVAATLIGTNYLIAFGTARSKKLCALVEGESVVLAKDGKLLHSSLRANNVPPSDVQEAVRAANLETLEEVRVATLEASGEITIVPKRGRKSAAAKA
jgi:uncharacterized membrane protein YcaP (DUF421 family)